MSEHMRKHHIESNSITMHHAGITYEFPMEIAEKYRVETPKERNVFERIEKKYTKAGVLLRGIRVREGLTQIQMAKKLKMAQSDISQMEKGTRKIGREVAQRIAKLFDVNYRSFLE